MLLSTAETQHERSPGIISMAENNLILSGSVKILFAWLWRASLCRSVSWQAGDVRAKGCRWNHNNRCWNISLGMNWNMPRLPFSTDVTYFSFESGAQRGPLFLWMCKQCGKSCQCQKRTLWNLYWPPVGLQNTPPPLFSFTASSLHTFIQEASCTYLLQPLWTLSYSAGRFVQGYRCGRCKIEQRLCQALHFIFTGPLLQSLGCDWSLAALIQGPQHNLAY